MLHQPEQNPMTPHPLPAEFGPDLEAIDAQVGAELARITPPSGLSNRIYVASVGMLPGPVFATIGPDTPTRTIGGSRRRLAWTSRAALAAALGLAFVVARPFAPSLSGTQIAGVQVDPGHTRIALVGDTAPGDIAGALWDARFGGRTTAAMLDLETVTPAGPTARDSYDPYMDDITNITSDDMFSIFEQVGEQVGM